MAKRKRRRRVSNRNRQTPIGDVAFPPRPQVVNTYASPGTGRGGKVKKRPVSELSLIEQLRRDGRVAA